ncbi:MAG: pilus assembly protein [Ruegeria sp.]|nr:pilus assembly protein [Ruegeria sp.]
MSRVSLNIRHFLSRWLRRENGALTVEALLIFPLFVLTVTLTYTFYDAFRQSTANLKAAYTVSDLISREKDGINDTYVTSMHLLMQRMVNNESEMRMRLSFIRFKEDEDRLVVDWSTSCGFADIWTNDNIETLRDRLPPLSDLEPLIIVETVNDYDWKVKPPWLDTDYQFENFIFTRPRVADQISADDLSEQGCTA